VFAWESLHSPGDFSTFKMVGFPLSMSMVYLSLLFPRPAPDRSTSAPICLANSPDGSAIIETLPSE
jgi:hypothetical protein